MVREPQIHEEVIRKIIDYADSIGFEVLHLEYSPIKTGGQYRISATYP